MFSFFRRNAPISQPEPESPRLLERVKKLESLLAEVDDDLKALNIKHYKLAGRFYSHFGGNDVPSQPDDSHLSPKDRLRKQLGIIAGRPAPHRSE